MLPSLILQCGWNEPTGDVQGLRKAEGKMLAKGDQDGEGDRAMSRRRGTAQVVPGQEQRQLLLNWPPMDDFFQIVWKSPGH